MRARRACAVPLLSTARFVRASASFAPLRCRQGLIAALESGVEAPQRRERHSGPDGTFAAAVGRVRVSVCNSAWRACGSIAECVSNRVRCVDLAGVRGGIQTRTPVSGHRRSRPVLDFRGGLSLRHSASGNWVSHERTFAAIDNCSDFDGGISTPDGYWFPSPPRQFAIGPCPLGIQRKFVSGEVMSRKHDVRFLRPAVEAGQAQVVGAAHAGSPATATAGRSDRRSLRKSGVRVLT